MPLPKAEGWSLFTFGCLSLPSLCSFLEPQTLLLSAFGAWWSLAQLIELPPYKMRKTDQEPKLCAGVWGTAGQLGDCRNMEGQLLAGGTQSLAPMSRVKARSGMHPGINFHSFHPSATQLCGVVLWAVGSGCPSQLLVQGVMALISSLSL